MCDDLNDFDDFEIEPVPVDIVKNEELTNRLKERKLVEESDLAIVKRLFGIDEEEVVAETKPEPNKIIINSKPMKFNKIEIKRTKQKNRYT